MFIVTHTSPDWDAIAGCWLLQRYGDLGDCYVEFVNTGTPDPKVIDAASAVVDTGKVYDAATNRFDHHQMPLPGGANTSATELVYFVLLNRTVEDLSESGTVRFRALNALSPLVRLITSGDTGKKTHGADISRALGIHALLSAKKAQRVSDRALLDFGYDLLDLLATRLVAQAQAQNALERCTVYTSDDGLIVALLDAPMGVTYAAFEAGARLVVFHDSTNPDTVPVGVQRSAEWATPHVGEIIGTIDDPALNAELETWFRHPAGFFAGRGTAKAPDKRPLGVNVAIIAAAVDAAWER